MVRALTSCEPGGTFKIRKRPSASTTAPSEVPLIVTCAVVIGAPVRASVTRPVSVPVCASKVGAPIASISDANAVASKQFLRYHRSLTWRFDTDPPRRERIISRYSWVVRDEVYKAEAGSGELCSYLAESVFVDTASYTG